MHHIALQAMLAEYAANPLQNWKSKDCAIYLVLALTVRGKTGAHTVQLPMEVGVGARQGGERGGGFARQAPH